MSWEKSLNPTPPEVQLRPFEESDFAFLLKELKDKEALFQWGATSFQFPISASSFASFLSSHSCFPYVLATKNEILAYGDLIHEEAKEVRLCRLLVSSNSRGKGIGKLLVRSLAKEAQQRFPNLAINLFVFEKNKAARACYEKCGFRYTTDQFELIHNGITNTTLKMTYHGN